MFCFDSNKKKIQINFNIICWLSLSAALTPRYESTLMIKIGSVVLAKLNTFNIKTKQIVSFKECLRWIFKEGVKESIVEIARCQAVKIYVLYP